MIRLEVEDYCHECLEFTANVTPPHRETYPVPDYTDDWGPGSYMTDTIIECKNKNRCAKIKRYLERKMRGEEKG